MTTTHVFIVDKDTFPIHLKYMFAGTGFKDNDINLNHPQNIDLNATVEKTIVGLLSDIKRVRAGDKVLFYLTQTPKTEGKFFGIFKIKEHSPLVFHEKEGLYLGALLKKKLIFRTLIEPYEVYPLGVTEWEALDNIEDIRNPKDLIWSLIYRKLKGNRGCTPITNKESDKLIKFIKEKNKDKFLQNSSNLFFDEENQKIKEDVAEPVVYDNLKAKRKLNIFPLMKLRHDQKRSHEAHLQTYVTENAGRIPNLNKVVGDRNEIIWLGNEVSCGVGMQRIDVFTICNINREKEFRVIELKSVYAIPDITRQLKRYVDWTKIFIDYADIGKIQPMILSLKIPEYSRSRKRKYETDEKKIYSDFFRSLINSLKEFNSENSCKPVRFFEYEIVDGKIEFEEINYN